MPVYIEGNPQARPSGNMNCLHVGLINNMPDAALEATERQFFKLLNSAANGLPVRLSLYTLPGVPRSEFARQHIRQCYSDVENLWNSRLDGLIVTGREPRARNLMDEPYWVSLTGVLEWARDNTHSTVWSCLAAHAAILHLDGIQRRKSDQKRCGVLDCVRLSNHPLTAGLPSRLKMPHSRWNDIPENELVDCGYNVLTRAQDAGVDTFVKQLKSLFVFFQGHPEYESDTLLLEYRRDVGRYLRGDTDTYPSLPQRYFDQATAEKMTTLQERARFNRQENLLAEMATFDERTIENTWHVTAKRVYCNWLRYLSRKKKERPRRQPSSISPPGDREVASGFISAIQ